MKRVGAAVLALAIIAGLASAVTPGPRNEVSTLAAYSPMAGTTFKVFQDFPDPDVIRDDGTYYAYATNSADINVQVAVSENLNTWTLSAQDALPDLPSWSQPGMTWAPDVSKISTGHYVLYFTAVNENAAPPRQCIGVATSSGPEGPFHPVGTKPLVCPIAEGGAIDADSFTDTDGIRYLVWKNDGNCCGKDTWLQIARLSPDGLTIVGPTTKLIKQTLPWEGTLIEAPTLIKRGGLYVLFYSANDYSAGKYAIGYATATSLLGPYTKHTEPLLTTQSSDGLYIGPGGQDVVTAPDGSDRLVFHSWSLAGAYRSFSVVPLTENPGCGCFTAGFHQNWSICC